MKIRTRRKAESRNTSPRGIAARIPQGKKLKAERTGGSVLIVVMGTVFVLGIALAAVLGLARQEHRVLARTGKWNSALPVAEAGIEEAMSHLHENGPGSTRGGVLGYLGIDGWTLSNGAYSRQRTLTTDTYYQVSISNTVPPIISCRGYQRASAANTYISRTVRIVATNTPLFTVSFGARATITMSGSGASADSFDSSKPGLSTNGQYDPTKTSTNGDVVSVTGPVDFGNHTIKGDLYLGPTASYVSASNQVSGNVYHDYNLDFPDVVPPAGFATWLPALTANLLVNGTIYKYAFLGVGGDYTISDSGSIYVGPGANVRLRVTTANFNPGGVRIGGLTNNAGKLTVFMAGATCTLGGNTTVDSGNASNFAYYGLPSNTSLTYSGGSCFVGTIYAPNADLTLNGGGNNSGVIGSSITKTITLNGHYNFHYDENLVNGQPRGYTIAAWREL